MWHKIFFNTLNIQAQTDRTCMIKMPNNSRWNGYHFWHPSKLIRQQGGKGYHSTFSFTDDFEFRLLKYGRGIYNAKDVIREEIVTPIEMLEAFSAVNESVHTSVEQETEKLIEQETDRVTIERHIPKPLQPMNILPDESLTK